MPKFATLLDAAEENVLVLTAFPPAHRAKIHNTNPPERVNGEIQRRTNAAWQLSQ